MKKYKQQKQTVTAIYTITCDRCDLELYTLDGYIDFSHSFGYGYRDGEKDSFQLCHTCYEELIKKSNIKVHKRDYLCDEEYIVSEFGHG